MKKLLLIASLIMLAGTGFGQMLAAGTSEVNVSGLLDFESADDTLFELDVFYGVFMVDYFELGGELSIRESDNVSIWAVGVGAEYNFDLGTELVPFVGAHVALARYDIEAAADDSEDDSALLAGASVGAKFFIVENIALSAEFTVEWASEDIYDEQDEWADSDSRLTVGMRFFF